LATTMTVSRVWYALRRSSHGKASTCRTITTGGGGACRGPRATTIGGRCWTRTRADHVQGLALNTGADAASRASGAASAAKRRRETRDIVTSKGAHSVRDRVCGRSVVRCVAGIRRQVAGECWVTSWLGITYFNAIV
jgi:hypothetical protein